MHPARLSRRHPWGAWAGVVVCAAFLVGGILLLLGGIREWQIESASVNWPMTQATITHAQTVKGSTGPRRGGYALAIYRRELSVRYTVESIEYTYDFILPAEGSSTLAVDPSRGAMAPTADRDHVTLYYNPENPHEVVLHPGDMYAGLNGMILGGTLTVFFSIFTFVVASRLPKPRAKG
jgi:hypothetical protein